MKAISYESFGGLDVLALTDVPAPQATPGHVIVRVHAGSINPLDGKIRRGELKLMSGSHFPKIAGRDFSGVIEAVGEGAAGFAVGDEVYGCVAGMKGGALCERVAVTPETIARKPRSLTFADAAAVPIVALAALQALREVAAVQPGARVLVNGCTGGVGLYALQLGRRLGAEVTGVCGTAGVAIAERYGAHAVIDYRKEELRKPGRTFDVLLELSGKLSFAESHELLSPHGVYVDLSPTPAALIGNTLANPFRAQKHRFLMSAPRPADLTELAAWLDDGSLRPAPTRTFPLAEFREAFQAAEQGGLVGKIALQLA